MSKRIKIPNRKSTAYKANALLNQLIDVLNSIPEDADVRAKYFHQVAEIMIEEADKAILS